MVNVYFTAPVGLHAKPPNDNFIDLV